jgi:hypothetical protein
VLEFSAREITQEKKMKGYKYWKLSISIGIHKYWNYPFFDDMILYFEDQKDSTRRLVDLTINSEKL